MAIASLRAELAGITEVSIRAQQLQQARRGSTLRSRQLEHLILRRRFLYSGYLASLQQWKCGNLGSVMAVVEVVWRHLLVSARGGRRQWPSVTALSSVTDCGSCRRGGGGRHQLARNAHSGGFGAVIAHLGVNRIAYCTRVLFYGDPKLPRLRPPRKGRGPKCGWLSLTAGCAAMGA
jgi:hypothetical protein